MTLAIASVLAAALGLTLFARQSAGPRRTTREASLASAAHTATSVNFGNRALAFGWQGVAETRFGARRLQAEHTTVVRFMAAYEGAYRGVVLADDSGQYRLGLAPYASLASPAVEVAVGGATFTHPLAEPVLTDNDFRNGVPKQAARKWRALALTRKGRQVAVYLDGARVGEFTAGDAPETGTLRFGRLSTPLEFRDQFYGFVDDVAIFARALSDSELRALAQSQRLDGKETGLLAAWLFDDPASGEPFTLRGSAALREVSSERLDGVDSQRLPTPSHHTRFTLPFAEGEVWLVIQGMNSALSHNDVAAFALDFLRVEPSLVSNNPGRVPGGSHGASAGAAFVAAADGKLSARVDCFPNDNRAQCPVSAYREPSIAPPAGVTANRNLACLEHTAGEVSCGLHLQSASVLVKQGEPVARGHLLGEVGGTGVPRVHLHFAVSDGTEPNEPGSFAPLVTFPFEFSDYEVSSDFGASWQRVAKGVPSPGQWLRRPASHAPRAMKQSLSR